MKAPKDIATVLAEAAANFAERPALTGPRAGHTEAGTWGSLAELETMDYGTLHERVEAMAHCLRGRLQPSQRLGLWAANSQEWVIVYLASLVAKVPVVVLNAALPVADATAMLRRADVSLVAMTGSHRGKARMVEGLIGEAEVLLLEELSITAANSEQLWPDRETAVIQFTSGTTGTPKGVMLSEKALLANGRLSAEHSEHGPHDVVFSATPLAHVGGYGQFLLGGLQSGLHMIVAGGFDAGGYLDVVQAYGVTVAGAVPTMWTAILEEQARTPRTVSSVRLVVSGATDQPSAVVRAVSECFNARYQVFYGMTESSGAVCGTRAEDRQEAAWTGVGRALDGVSIKVVDPGTEQVLSSGAAGEVYVHSPGVMLGYLDDLEASRETITHDGWLRTGDLGVLDEAGHLRIKGRLKDVIIKGGENISPVEVEEKIRTLPGVADVAVVGVPDDRWGEVPAAALVLADPAHTDLSAVRAVAAATLGAFLAPSHWHLVAALPVTTAGKVDKFALRNTLTHELRVG